MAERERLGDAAPKPEGAAQVISTRIEPGHYRLSCGTIVATVGVCADKNWMWEYRTFVGIEVLPGFKCDGLAKIVHHFTSKVREIVESGTKSLDNQVQPIKDGDRCLVRYQKTVYRAVYRGGIVEIQAVHDRAAGFSRPDSV
jgi:hypothetical protein